MNLTFSAKRASRLAIVAIIGAGLAASANAETVLVDFGSTNSFRGINVPNPDPNGHYWNSLTPGPFFPGLVDINNAVTTVALGFDTPVGTDSFNGPAGVTSFPNPTPAEVAATDIDTVALGDLGVKEAAIDFAASPGGGAGNLTRFQIQGLDPSETYTLKLFGSHKFSDNDATTYSIFTDNTYSSLVASTTLNVQSASDPSLHNRDTIATLSGLAPQTSNIFYVQFVGSQGGMGYLNSFELVGSPVPEPTSLMLLASGVALAFGYRRR
ncbi:MAG TPA: PEP-CTERM sorting domain-containing protein [Lacipirellulaceae bacterium]|jgi:hypothetical protein|nr:PEP-CTERM sorting domain-containing protein [Lacipirellulaceae bacterium]